MHMQLLLDTQSSKKIRRVPVPLKERTFGYFGLVTQLLFLDETVKKKPRGIMTMYIKPRHISCHTRLRLKERENKKQKPKKSAKGT